MIYFQVVDRTVRKFLNDWMPRFDFPVAAGETPPGLTDSLIFYDPLVTPTRPGHILPAKWVSLLEEGKTAEAEKFLIELILESARGTMVQHDGEMEMLTIEEEEHRVRMKEIGHRRKMLSDLCDTFGGLIGALRDWKPRPPSAESSPSAVSAPAPAAPAAAGPSDGFLFYSNLLSRVQSVMDKNGGGLSSTDFDESFCLLFDRGLALSPEEARRSAVPKDASSHRVMHVTDYLVWKFSETYQLPKMGEIEETLSSVRRSLSDLKTRFARLQQKRLEILSGSGLNPSADLDRLTQSQYRYFRLADKQRKSTLTPEDVRQFGVLEEEIGNIDKKIESEIYLRYPSSSEFLSTFKRLNQAIVQSLQEWIRLEDEERGQQEVLAKLRDSYRNAAPADRRKIVEEQIQRLRQFADLLTARGRRRPFTPVVPPPHPVATSRVFSVMDQTALLDTTLFPEKFLKRRGPPKILLLPSFGSGLYDWKDGLLVISVYPDNVESAVLAALAEFRLDADESRDLFTSYTRHIGRNRNLGFVKLKEMFISDYTAWIEKEAAGYRVMEKEVRVWFERNVPLRAAQSPNKS